MVFKNNRLFLKYMGKLDEVEILATPTKENPTCTLYTNIVVNYCFICSGVTIYKVGLC